MTGRNKKAKKAKKAKKNTTKNNETSKTSGKLFAASKKKVSKTTPFTAG